MTEKRPFGRLDTGTKGHSKVAEALLTAHGEVFFLAAVSFGALQLGVASERDVIAPRDEAHGMWNQFPKEAELHKPKAVKAREAVLDLGAMKPHTRPCEALSAATEWGAARTAAAGAASAAARAAAGGETSEAPRSDLAESFFL
jgi:hypothetical protein